MTELSTQRLEARKLIRANIERMIADNALKAVQAREAGEVVTEFYDNGDDDIEGKN